MPKVKQNGQPKYCRTNQLEFLKNRVMKAMMQHRHSLPFRNLGDGQEEGNMDLTTIKAKLENGRYCSALECIEDFKFVFSNCYKHNQPDDTIVEKAHSLETFLETKLALMPKEEQEVDDANMKKPVKEIFGLQDYMSSYFTPEQGRRSRKMTQHFEVGSAGRTMQSKKRKSGEDSSGVKSAKEKVFVRSSSSKRSQANNIGKAHISHQQKTKKEFELEASIDEKKEVKKLDDEVEEINEYIVEEIKTDSKVEEEAIEVESGNSGSEAESDDSESGEDWATQYSNSIRRFYKSLHLRFLE